MRDSGARLVRPLLFDWVEVALFLQPYAIRTSSMWVVRSKKASDLPSPTMTCTVSVHTCLDLHGPHSASNVRPCVGLPQATDVLWYPSLLRRLSEVGESGMISVRARFANCGVETERLMSDGGFRFAVFFFLVDE